MINTWNHWVNLKVSLIPQVFDNIIIAGDFNVDFNHHSTSSEYLIRFMNDLQLCAVDVLSCYNINFTYERDDGLVHSWPDHILTFNYCAGDISTVKCIHSPDNFSDHVPLVLIYVVICSQFLILILRVHTQI